MITSAEFENIPLFAGVEEQEQRLLARRAADIHLEPGEWLIREGEESRFLVILAGELETIGCPHASQLITVSTHGSVSGRSHR